MEEEKYRLLSDLKKIEAMLRKTGLRDERAREKLARLLCNKNMFAHRVGMLFIESLTKAEGYSVAGYQKRVVDDCVRFAELLEHCEAERIDEVEELQRTLLEEDNLLFRSWMRKPAIYYVNYFLERRKRELYQAANQDQNHDIAVIHSLSSQYVFDKEEDANRLYGYLLENKGTLFRSWIGADFAEKIQRRTTEYKRLAKRRRMLCRMAACCAVLAVLIVLPTMYTFLHDYTNQVKAQVLDSIRNDSATKIADDERADSVPRTAENGIAGSAGEGQQPEILEKYRKLYDLNPDLAGWLEVEGIGLSLPVMQKRMEEDFYLSHNFYQEPEKRGALFIDANTSVFPVSENVVIYGHNMSDGTMFGQLRKYEEEDFCLAHPSFSFDTLYEHMMYEVAAVVSTNIRKENEEGFRYDQFYDYGNQEEFQEFIDFIRQNRLYETGADFSYGDTFVVLSTCEYSVEEGRLLVVGRRVD